jgi:ElaB/YqjD/DUF883 family membrane-anchored ribosome-binding protein
LAREIPEDEMNDAMKDFADSVAADPNYARLEKDIQAVKNDIVHLSSQISDAVTALSGIAQTQTRRGVRRARSNVNALMSDASDRASTVASAAQDTASSIGESVADAIEDRPLATVAIAMGLGFLIGVTWRR